MVEASAGHSICGAIDLLSNLKGPFFLTLGVSMALLGCGAGLNHDELAAQKKLTREGPLSIKGERMATLSRHGATVVCGYFTFPRAAGERGAGRFVYVSEGEAISMKAGDLALDIYNDGRAAPKVIADICD